MSETSSMCFFSHLIIFSQLMKISIYNFNVFSSVSDPDLFGSGSFWPPGSGSASWNGSGSGGKVISQDHSKFSQKINQNHKSIMYFFKYIFDRKKKFLKISGSFIPQNGFEDPDPDPY